MINIEVDASWRPDRDRRLRGLERRRRSGHRRGRAPARSSWTAELVAALDPEDYYDFQVNRPHVGIDADGERRAHLADHPASGAPPAPGAEPRRRAGPRHRAEHALASLLHEMLELRHDARRDDVRHARRAARRHPAHPAGPGHRHVVRPDARRASTASSRPATRARPASSGSSRRRPHRRGLPALSSGRRCRTTSRSRPPRRRRWRCSASSRTCSTSPIACAALPEEARAWERGVDELASEDAEVAEYVRSLEEEHDTADLPEATGDAIAREFERYLRRSEAPTPDPRPSLSCDGRAQPGLEAAEASSGSDGRRAEGDAEGRTRSRAHQRTRDPVDSR